MKWFQREVQGIEAEAKRFIDESFKYLRSAEGAFDLLLKFQHIKSRKAGLYGEFSWSIFMERQFIAKFSEQDIRPTLLKVINEQMMNKLHEILKQYEKEVDMINEMFLKNKQSPPLSKGQPPIGGAILWERSLFERIKKTIVRFLTYEEMMDCEEGKAVKAHYLRIAKQMKVMDFNSYKSDFVLI